MKTADITNNAFRILQGIMLVTVCCLTFVNPALSADSPPQASPQKNVDLVLSLPSQWQTVDSSRFSGMQKLALPSGNLGGDTTVGQQKADPVNVGCNVGTYDASVTTASFANRMEGNCKLNYHY